MRSFLLRILLLLTWASCALAQYENTVVEVNIKTQTMGQQAQVILEVVNKGLNPLLDIQAYLQDEQLHIPFESTKGLEPGESLHAALLIDIPTRLIGGNFFLPIKVSYKDIDNERISSVSLAKFISAPNAQRPFELTLEEPSSASNCQETIVGVKNLQISDADLILTLVTPDGIRAEPLTQSAELSANQSTDLGFKLCHDRKFANGQYPIHVIASTVSDGLVFQTVLSTNIQIESSSWPSRFFQNQIIVGSLALAAFLILCFAWLLAIFKSGKAINLSLFIIKN